MFYLKKSTVRLTTNVEDGAEINQSKSTVENFQFEPENSDDQKMDIQ